jgi:hypothetical protein
MGCLRRCIAALRDAPEGNRIVAMTNERSTGRKDVIRERARVGHIAAMTSQTRTVTDLPRDQIIRNSNPVARPWPQQWRQIARPGPLCKLRPRFGVCPNHPKPRKIARSAGVV